MASRPKPKRSRPSARRYLMWPDAGINTTRSATVQNTVGPLVRYERGIALEKAATRPPALNQRQNSKNAYAHPEGAPRALDEAANQQVPKRENEDAAHSAKGRPAAMNAEKMHA